MRSYQRGHGSDGSLLDSPLPDLGTPRLSCRPGQRPADQKCGWAKDRREGLPVDSTLAYLWIAPSLLSAGGSLLRVAHLPSSPRRIGERAQHPMPAPAEVTLADAYSTDPGAQLQDE